jgi:uncharacterized protein
MIDKYYLTITKACNMNCIYCMQGSTKPSQFFDEVDPMIVKNYFPKEGDYRITFYGGEPFLRFDYMIRLAIAIKERNANARLAVITNGTLLNMDRAKRLNELDIFCTVSHDGRNFASTRKAKDFLQYDPEPYLTLNKRAIAATVSRVNYDYYDVWDYLLEFKEKHGLPQREACRIDTIRDAEGNTDESLLIADMPEFEVMLDRVFANLEANLAAGNSNCYEYEQYLPMFMTLQYRIKNQHMCAWCGVDTNVAHMDIYGNLYPCHNMENPNNHVSGGIRPGSFNPYINTDKCQNCEAFLYCGGGCVAVALNKKHYECYVTRQQFSRLMRFLTRLQGGLA